MIVVDTTVIAYLHIPGDRTQAARAVFREDPNWAAPLLWRSEFRNVLVLYMREGSLSLAAARGLARKAESLLMGREHLVDTAAVLELAARSACSAYDCEFVALARELGVSLLTADREILAAFPGDARALGEI